MINEIFKKLLGCNDLNRRDEENKFQRNNNLIVKKIFEYMPSMLITNLSTLLLITADGVVVGNFIDDMDLSLSAISVFYPASLLISVFTTLMAIGISSALSNCIGYNDNEKLNYVKNAMKFLLVIAFFVVAIIQIPIVLLILKLYNLEPKLYDLALKYGTGIMILNPFAVISTVCVYQLQILGKVKVIMLFAISESLLNIFFDLLFVGYFKFDITGVAMGTAIASITRSVGTFIYLLKATDIYKSENNKLRIQDMREILMLGTPEAVYDAATAFQKFAMMKIILLAFGSYGGAINGVCNFCNSLAIVLIMAIVSSMRPLVGLFEGAKDTFALKNVIKIGVKLLTLSVGIIILIIEISPRFFFDVHGVDEVNITTDALMSLSIYAIYFILSGINSILRLYLTNKKDIKILSMITMCSYLLLPAFAYIFYKFFNPPMVWLSSSIVALIAMFFYIIRYKYHENNALIRDVNYAEGEIKYDSNKKYDYNELKKNMDERKLYLSIRPEDATEASKYIEKYIIGKGKPDVLANRMSLCIEEMIAYSKKAKNKKDVNNQITLSIHDNKGEILIFDDGEEIHLNDDRNIQDFMIDNYSFVKKIAKSYHYQYVLKMNHTLLEF